MQVPQEALCWSFRADKLLQQILEPVPDIVCLQEVNKYGEIPAFVSVLLMSLAADLLHCSSLTADLVQCGPCMFTPLRQRHVCR